MSTRQAFYKALLKHFDSSQSDSAYVNLGSMASALGVTQGVLTRYLAEAKDADWLQTDGRSTKLILLNRQALEDAVGLTQEVKSRGVAG